MSLTDLPSLSAPPHMQQRQFVKELGDAQVRKEIFGLETTVTPPARCRSGTQEWRVDARFYRPSGITDRGYSNVDIVNCIVFGTIGNNEQWEYILYGHLGHKHECDLSNLSSWTEVKADSISELSNACLRFGLER